MALPTLEATVSLNTTKFESGIKKMQASWKSLTDNMAKLGAASAAVFTGMTLAIGKATQTFATQEIATKKLEIAINRFALADKRLTKQLKQTANELQDMTGIGNEVIEAVASMGLSMGISGEKIIKATKAAVVMNQVLGMEMTSAMRNLAKTTAGMTGELGEAIPFIRELTTEQLKSGEAIDLIIDKLGGFSQELSNMTDVHIKRAKAALGDIGEAFGSLFAPEAKEIADFVSNLSQSLAKLTPESQATIKSLAKLGMTFAALGAALGAFALIWKTTSFIIRTGISVITNPWLLLIAGIATGAAIIIGHWDDMRREAAKAFGSMEDNWKGAYDSYAEIWTNPDIGGLEKLAATVGKFSGEVWHGWNSAWQDSYDAYYEIWSDPDLTGIGKLAGTFAKFFKDNLTGWQKGWSDSYKAYADVWKDPELNGIQKLGATFSMTIKKLWHGTEDTPGLKDVFTDAWDNLVSIWSDPDLSFWEKVWETMKEAPVTVANAVQSVGASITDLLGGDSIKYLENTDNALKKVKERLDSIGKSENVAQMINNVLAAGVEITQLPAQFLLGGVDFESDFNKKMTEKLITAGFIATATGLVSGSWHLGVILGVASIFLGENALTLDPEKPLWVNISDIGLSLAGGYAALMSAVGVGKWLSGILAAKMGVAGISVSLPKLVLMVGAIKIGWEAGSFAGNKLVEEGIADKWDSWMQDTLGEFYTDTISKLQTGTFLEQLNASGVYFGLTILAGLKWAFDSLLDFGTWVWEKVKNAALTIYEAGLEIGNQLLEGIKYIFGFGWLQDLLGLGIEKPSGATEDPETGRISGGREGFAPAGGGEGMRFKRESYLRPELEKMYAMAGFPESGIEIRSTPLPKEVTDKVNKFIKDYTEKTLLNQAYSGIGADLTTIAAPAMEKLTLDLISALNQSLVHPTVVASLAYAESKYQLGAKGGEGRGPFQFESVGIEQAKKWYPTNWDYETAATDTVYSTMAAEKTIDWLVDSFGSLRDALIAWNRGFGNTQKWISEGADLSTLPDATKILLTNFMVEFENLIGGDWSSLNQELRNQIAEVAEAVNYFVENSPEVIAKSFTGEPHTFNITQTLDEVKERLDELIQTTEESVATDTAPTILERIEEELISLNSTVELIHNRLGRIRDLMWERGYQSGGYTGNIATNAIAGVVHGGEWVAPAWMVEAYPDLFGRLESMRQRSTTVKLANTRGYASGGIVEAASMNTMFASVLDTVAVLVETLSPLTDVMSLGFDKILEALENVIGENESAKNLIASLRNLNSEMNTTFESTDEMLRDMKDQLLAMKESLEEIEGNTSATVIEMLPDLAGEFGRKMWELITERERASITGGLGRTGQWAIPNFEAEYRDSFINVFAGAMEVVLSTLSGELSGGAASILSIQAVKNRLSFAPEAGAAISASQGIEGLAALGMEASAAAGAIGLVVLGAGLLYRAFDSLIDVMGSIRRGFDRGIGKTIERLQRPLEIVGEILGNSLAPILQMLTPLLDGFARAIAWFYNEIYLPIANFFGAGLERIDIEGRLNYEADDTMATKSYSAGVTGSVTNNISIEIDTYGLVDPDGIRKLYELLGDYVEDLELVR